MFETLKTTTKYLLRDAGFYEVNIFRKVGPISAEPCNLERVSFEDLKPTASLDIIMDNVLSNFKPISEFGGSKITSTNSCLCTKGIEELETQFQEGDVKIWAHQFFSSSTEPRGKLFIKGRMPFDNALPILAQKNHLSSIHGQILSANTSTSEQGRVIFSNLFMPHPIGGYEPEDLCDLTGPIDPEAFYLSPAGIPIKLPGGSYNEIFTDEENSEGIFEGALVKFNFGSIIIMGIFIKKKSLLVTFTILKLK